MSRINRNVWQVSSERISHAQSTSAIKAAAFTEPSGKAECFPIPTAEITISSFSLFTDIRSFSFAFNHL
jgi:hypothetical protein